MNDIPGSIMALTYVIDTNRSCWFLQWNILRDILIDSLAAEISQLIYSCKGVGECDAKKQSKMGLLCRSVKGRELPAKLQRHTGETARLTEHSYLSSWIARAEPTISMFNQNFSFGSSSHSPAMAYGVDDLAPRRDSRFDSYRYVGAPRHPSITALTAQLQSQALNDMDIGSPSPPPSDIVSSSSSSDTDGDEGFYDGPETPDTNISDFPYESNDVDPTLWDLSMSDSMVATSSPRPSLSLEAQALSSYTMRRRQRQALIRLQCIATRAPDLAMLIEECHPSSLPLETNSVRAYSPKERSESVCSYSALLGSTNGRIEKERHGSTAAVRKTPRMRKRVSTR
ncbi:uncharacterized protein A1O9_10666 [Exophiala aquamarina CBS 119918]|uniref:Uncharacterized protein n=1 Tax=Exophiala aquamarina CBS 119918 TaxID=1182545 RepID=A0A072P1R6_9EURO|nr:uncharacterized protein A1O9_10666 [Exophiala aquamarina CBS 119918]KEF53218.1 hypothetical protein A1O9_10666 [Exophiala aquamarina CBS 119918]